MKPWRQTLLYISLISLLNIGHLAWAQMEPPPRTLLPSDGVPWQFDNPYGTWAIGDIHGDYGALTTTLSHPHVALIDSEGNWSGGKKTLMLLGDLNGRGPHTPLIYHLLMRLEQQAAAAGGRVIVVQSDHTLLVLASFLKYVNRDEYLYWDRLLEEVSPVEFAIAIPRSMVHLTDQDEVELFYAHRFYQGFDKFLLAHRGNHPIAQWLRRFNTIVQVGDTLFVHGGFDPYSASQDPAQINATVRAWAAYYQEVGDKPPLSTSWTIGFNEERLRHQDYRMSGPLWIRNMFNLNRKHKFLDALLKKWGVKRVVVGHERTHDVKKNRNGTLRHLLPPEFEPRSDPHILKLSQGKIWMIDTAISRWSTEDGKGALRSALLIEDGMAIPLHIDTLIPDDNTNPFFLKELARCTKK